MLREKILKLILTSLFCFCAYSKADVTNGLIVHLKLDETNGLTAFDSTTNSHPATLINFQNTNSQWVAGQTNGGLFFNANTNNQRAAISDNGSLNFGAKTNPVFSLALWVKGTPNIQSPGAGVLAKGFGRGGEQFAIDVYANSFRFFVRSAAGTSFLVSGPTVDGSWQHLVATYDSVNTSGGLKFYANGELLSSANSPSTLTNYTHEISLGSREDNISSGYNLPFFGIEDDVRIYNRALSATNVQELYLATGGNPPPPEGDYDSLRLHWLATLNSGTNLNVSDSDVSNRLVEISASAQSLWSSMDKSAGRTFLWSDLPGTATNSSQLWYTYDRLKTLALAYATVGTTLHGNISFRTDLFSALDWMYTNRYNETKSEIDNWWHWEIGVPLRLNDITVLLYDELSGAQIANYMNAIDKFSPSPTGTGANLLWKATVVGVRGAIVKSSSKITSAAASLSSLFPYVTTGDGFYDDGSFIQHNYFAYTGSYGSSLMVYIAPLLQMLEGSNWQVTDAKKTNVYQWVYNSYQPTIYKGAMMDMVRGRAASREDETDQIIGEQTVAAILRLAQFAPPVDAAALKSVVKYWIQSDTAQNFLATADLASIPFAKIILADTNVISRGELIGHYNFGSMDRVAHLRPGFGFGISMSSSRIANYESINVENLHGWYSGEGMTYLYNDDQTQFSDGFWPTVNAYRLPGTTVDTQVRAASSGANYRGVYNWVGGATLENFGTAGMQLDAWNSTLTAKKSWFMFDDEIVCLGAGITSSDNRDIETILENRKLNFVGNNPLTVNGIMKTASLNWSETMSNISWAHLVGSSGNASIGYYFPQAASLKGLREARSGSWYDINHTEVVTVTNLTRNFLTLWFDHGTNPLNAVYSYVLLPGKSASEVANYAANPNVVVLQNSSAIQAAKEIPLGITAANFWNDGVQTIAGITVDRKASVVLQTNLTSLAISVADPTQTNSTNISITVNQPVAEIISLDSGMTVTQLKPTLQIIVNPTNAKGKSFYAKFSLDITNFAGFQNENFSQTQLLDSSISGVEADPDYDGLNNLMEYALMQNPLQPSGNALQARVENGHFILTFTKRKLATDIFYEVDVSTNLVTWDITETQFDETILSETSTAQIVQVTDKSVNSAFPTRYFKLQVRLQP